MNFLFLLEALIKIIALIFLMIMPLVAYSSLAERRVSAIIQDRIGPNRVGIPFTKIGLFGLGQPLADGIKFLLKEDFVVGNVRKVYYWLAPALTLIPAMLTCAVLPFGGYLKLPFVEEPIRLCIADLNIGMLYVFAIASLGVYGIVLAGWSSNSKYPFLGGVRSSSQMISYEIAMGLSIIPMLMIFGDLNLGHIAEYQHKNGWALLPITLDGWLPKFHARDLALLVPVFISFIIFSVSLFAETNRLPFDLPECETELVAGYHTEYSSMKFALFFMGEYAAMIIGSGFAVTLFLGGWSLPFGLGSDGRDGFFAGLINMGCFLAKVVAFIIFFIWVRWSLPRFRYDQLMRLGWVFFFEIALANILLTAAIMMLWKS